MSWLMGLVQARRGLSEALQTAERLRVDMDAAWPAPHDLADIVEAEALQRRDPPRARALVERHLRRDISTLFDVGPGVMAAPAWALAATLAWRDDTAGKEYRAVVEQDSAEALEGSSVGLAWRREIVAHLARAEGRDSIDEWRGVVASWDEMGATYHSAVARTRLAELLVAEKESELAAEVLGQGLTDAKALGAEPLANQIRGLAARARLKLPGHEPNPGETGPLTAREHEVLQLLVQGMTNDEIGTTLFMSPRTASVHVSHILAKLQASNRTEVAAIAHRRGLVTGD